jgi:uncharacterized protein (DUF2336 family)
MLRRVTDLFCSRVDQFSSEHLGLFDEVMTKAVVYIEGEARAELSTRLAPVTRAPEGIIRRLAHDNDIAVAGPVLEQSERLTEADLLEIAKVKGRDHLLKLSNRRQLGEALTDVLVERGDAVVRRSVAANTGARFSEAGFSKLVIYAEQDEDLLTAVAKRTDMPPLLLRHALSRATDTVKDRLLAQSSPEHRKIVRKALEDVSGRVRESILTRQYGEAQRRLSSVTQDTAEAKLKLQAFAAERKMLEIIVLLSALSGVPIDLVDHMVNNTSQFGVMALCRAIGLDWRVVVAIISAKFAPHDPSSFDAIELGYQYHELSAASAQRVLRFWQSQQVEIDHTALPFKRMN